LTRLTAIRFRSRIATRLWAGMMALVVVVLVLLWLFQIVFLERFYDAIRVSSVAEDTTALAASLSTATVPEAADLFYSFAYRTGATAEWFDASGVLLLTSGSPEGRGASQGAWANLRLQSLPDVLAGMNTQTRVTHPRLGGVFVLIGRPVRADGLLVGALLVTLPMPAVEETASVLKQQLLWISLILTAVAVAFSLVLARSFSRPIRTITDAARRMSEGQFETGIHVRNRDEIGELAETLTKMGHDLSRVESLRREFVANMSHELRTPLTLIRGYAETLRDLDGATPETRRRQLDSVIAESERLARLVDDLLDLSRMQSETVQLDRIRVRLDHLAERVVDRFRGHAETTGMNVRLEAPLPCTVRADPARIEQVLYNLVQNALQHGARGGTATVRVHLSGNTVRCEVADDGPGIPPDELTGIWERFRRGAAATDRSRRGTGLGLAIVRSILTAHAARHGVESPPGSGATFWFELPAEAESTIS
jgi:signal transduction histidine kinase